MLAYQREVDYKIPGVNRKDKDETEADLETWKKLELIREEQQERIDSAVALTEAELAEKEELSKNGFGNWMKRDYWAFIRGNEKYGRTNYEEVTIECEGKTVEEVKAYSKVFWERISEIPDYLRTVAKIEEGEAKLAKLNEVQGVLSKRVSGLTAPLHQLKIAYGQIKGRSFSEEEDRFLLVMLDKFGYGDDESFEKIRQEIKRSSLFRFNWFFRSRNAGELSKRCSTLLLCIMKEWEEEQKAEGGEPKAKKMKTGGGVELTTKSFFAGKVASIPRKARK